MSQSAGVSEYYFSEHYRVLVIEEGDHYTVSVDVYRDEWVFTGHMEKCIGDTCLLVKELEPGSTAALVDTGVEGVVKTVVIGVRVKETRETVNVKWIMGRKPSYSDVEALYRASWRLIGCTREGCAEGAEPV
ncbi:hypothetical protein [Desulfurococcus mucosus]|uniref:Uncharacterized protein n=1 Tax=Desulfurococcus mucosus (strain ATCC 35584 / DSM 2162 / JCM 9187 / O7/1) TaxID=765177 RepID=E8RA40_DESM0|nr:hypothetical protein [Desulfurococcus mucosus]ADV65366.1 hypothetical protein Desmu_1064 [Desulfurococcus mucosus DSM 2162]